MVYLVPLTGFYNT